MDLIIVKYKKVSKHFLLGVDKSRVVNPRLISVSNILKILQLKKPCFVILFKAFNLILVQNNLDPFPLIMSD